jgi:hypothetical protein
MLEPLKHRLGSARHDDSGIAAPDTARSRRVHHALENALERLATEIRDVRRGWATGIRQDGTTVTLPAASRAATLLCTAGRQSLHRMIIGSDGWTFVMHPLMGVATLDEDPASS